MTTLTGRLWGRTASEATDLSGRISLSKLAAFVSILVIASFAIIQPGILIALIQALCWAALALIVAPFVMLSLVFLVFGVARALDGS
jgi:hypothetical protein